MKKILFHIIIVFLISCNGQESIKSINEKTKVEAQIVDRYSSGEPKEIRYYKHDTTLVHKLSRTGKLKDEYILKGLNALQWTSYFDNEKKEFKVESIDGITEEENIRYRIEYDSTGNIKANGLVKNDSVYIDNWIFYFDITKQYKLFTTIDDNGKIIGDPVKIPYDSLITINRIDIKGINHKIELK